MATPDFECLRTFKLSLLFFFFSLLYIKQMMTISLSTSRQKYRRQTICLIDPQASALLNLIIYTALKEFYIW